MRGLGAVPLQRQRWRRAGLRDSSSKTAPWPPSPSSAPTRQCRRGVGRIELRAAWQHSHHPLPAQHHRPRRCRCTTGSITDHRRSAMTERPGAQLARRPLHFFLLADCSGSMAASGKMTALNTAIREVLPHLAETSHGNPHAEVSVRAIGFSHRRALARRRAHASRRPRAGRTCSPAATPTSVPRSTCSHRADRAADGGARAAASGRAGLRRDADRRLRGGAGRGCWHCRGAPARTDGRGDRPGRRLRHAGRVHRRPRRSSRSRPRTPSS